MYLKLIMLDTNIRYCKKKKRNKLMYYIITYYDIMKMFITIKV